MVNRRFGLGTWEDIMMERDKRIEKAKTRKQKERERQKEKMEHWLDIAKNSMIMILVLLGMFIVFMFYTDKWVL